MPNFERDLLSEQQKMPNSIDKMLHLPVVPSLNREQYNLRAAYISDSNLFEDSISIPGVVISDVEKENFFTGDRDTFPKSYLAVLDECSDSKDKLTTLGEKIISNVDIINLTAICGGYYAKQTFETEESEDYKSQLTDLHEQLADKNKELLLNTTRISKARLAAQNYKTGDKATDALTELTEAQHLEIDIKNDISNLKAQISTTKKSYDNAQVEKTKARDKYVADRVREVDNVIIQLEALSSVLNQPSYTIIKKDLFGRDRSYQVSLEAKLADLLGISEVPNPIRQVDSKHLLKVLNDCILNLKNTKEIIPIAAGLGRVKTDEIAARRESSKTMLISPSNDEIEPDIDPLDALLGILGDNPKPLPSVPDNRGRKNSRLG
jgi:hypothetical protein